MASITSMRPKIGQPNWLLLMFCGWNFVLHSTNFPHVHESFQSFLATDVLLTSFCYCSVFGNFNSQCSKIWKKKHSKFVLFPSRSDLIFIFTLSYHIKLFITINRWTQNIHLSIFFPEKKREMHLHTHVHTHTHTHFQDH